MNPHVSKDMNEIHRLLDMKILKLGSAVKFKMEDGWVDTTAGRLKIWEISGYLPDDFLNKGTIKKLITHINRNYEPAEALRRLKLVQQTGFEVSTQSGISLCYDDFKFDFGIDFKEVEGQLSKMDKDERVEYADKIINECTARWWNEVDKSNPLRKMGVSGARVTDTQVRQMIVAKGILGSMDGGIADYPIMESLTTGLGVNNYFQTCGPARRGLADNFFVVPASGYFARQLVTVARDLKMVEHDCETVDTIYVPIEVARGRHELGNPNILTKADVESRSGEMIKMRSPITCESGLGGVCQKCAGLDPATEQYWRIGMGLGTASGQHVSEPTTQLGLRGKHLSGGVTLAGLKKNVSNVLADTLKTLGGRGTHLIGPQLSDAKGFHEYYAEEKNWVIATTNILMEVHSIFGSAGTKIASVHFEMILRGCTDIVKLPDNTYGLRSLGAEGKVTPVHVHGYGRKVPSWLKRLGYGYTNEVIKKAVTSLEPSLGGYTEQIIMADFEHVEDLSEASEKQYRRDRLNEIKQES